MRILHVSSTSTVSGANRYMFDLAAGQRDLGHAPIVAMPKLPGDAFGFGGKEIQRVELGDPRAFAFLGAVQRTRPDLIHCHDGTTARWTRFLPFRPKTLMTLHQEYKRATMDHFDGVHATADWQVANLSGFAGKVSRIYNWTPALSPASEADARRMRETAGAGEIDFLIVSLGRLEEVKGIHHLITAVRALPGGALRLAIIGAGPYEATLRAQAEGDARIRFLGRSAEPAAWYRAADLVAMPSRREPFGLVALEAMACGAPVLASNIEGLGEIFRDRPDCLIKGQDPAVIAARIAARAATKTGPAILRDSYDMSRFDRAAGVAAVTRFSHEVISG